MKNKIESLYNKYRPRNFSDLIGQEHISLVLTKGLANGRVSHAYLMCGSRGSGKTTTARILAMAFNCEKGLTPEPCGECEACRDIVDNRCIDIVEIDCASKNGVDHIRALQESVAVVSSQVRTKFYIMDEVHMLTSAAQNSFLKTLEEPPPNVVFILATTEPDKLKDTILSRTQIHQFHRIPAAKLAGRLLYIAEHEKVTLDEDAALSIARSCEGGARDAISKLDSAINVADDNHITLSVAAKVLGTIGIEIISKLADAIIANDTVEILKQIGNIVDNSAMLQPVYLEILRYFDNLMVASTSSEYVDGLDYGDSTNKLMKEQAAKKDTAWFLSAVEQMLKYGNLIDSVKGRIALETMSLSVANLNINKQPVIVQTTTPIESKPQRYEWAEIKSWFPPQAVFIMSKADVYADKDGLHIENSSVLAQGDKDVLKMQLNSIKKALIEKGLSDKIELTPNKTVAVTQVSANDFFAGA